LIPFPEKYLKRTIKKGKGYAFANVLDPFKCLSKSTTLWKIYLASKSKLTSGNKWSKPIPRNNPAEKLLA